MNRKKLVIKSFHAAFGLVVFASGLYCTIQANIGLAPWDCFNKGLAGRLGITYGQTSIMIGVVTIVIILLLKEKIGLGTILNVAICGPTVDTMTIIDVIPLQKSFVSGVLIMILGMFIMGLGRYLYMSAGLCCGPRDAMLVGIGKHLRKISIGTVNTMILCAVLLIGVLLGGKAGIGTLISAFGIGFAMQLTFNLFHFDPRSVDNVGLYDAVQILRFGHF